MTQAALPPRLRPPLQYSKRVPPFLRFLCALRVKNSAFRVRRPSPFRNCRRGFTPRSSPARAQPHGPGVDSNCIRQQFAGGRGEFGASLPPPRRSMVQRTARTGPNQPSRSGLSFAAGLSRAGGDVFSAPLLRFLRALRTPRSAFCRGAPCARPSIIIRHSQARTSRAPTTPPSASIFKTSPAFPPPPPRHPCSKFGVQCSEFNVPRLRLPRSQTVGGALRPDHRLRPTPFAPAPRHPGQIPG